MFEPEPIETQTKGKVKPESEEKEKFKIDSDSKADWALAQIKDLKDKVKEKEDFAEERKQQIDNWLEEETEKLEKQIDNLENMVKEYATKLKQKNKDFKTKKLPFGKIQFRKQRPKWKYDNDKLLETAKKQIPKAVKTKEKVYKSKLKKAIKEGSFEIVDGKVINTETGELLEGIEVQERDEKLSIKVEGDK